MTRNDMRNFRVGEFQFEKKFLFVVSLSFARFTLSHRKPLARWKKSKRDAEKSTFSSEKKSKTSDGYEQTWVEEKVDKELTRAGRARATRTAKTRTDLFLNRLCFSCARKRASRSARARLRIKERTFLSFGCCF